MKVTPDEPGIYVPRNITLTFLYFQRDSFNKEIINGMLDLDDFSQIPDKSQIYTFYSNLYNLNLSNPVDEIQLLNKTKLYEFFAQATNQGWMQDISNFIMQNVYSNTTQFKNLFGEYWNYKYLSSFGHNFEKLFGDNKKSSCSSKFFIK
jgi:hypothetical protein